MVEKAKTAGPLVLLSLEAGHNAGRRDKIQSLLEGYPLNSLARRAQDLRLLVEAAGYTELPALRGRHPRRVPL